MLKKSILIWISILPLAILNGGLRDKILTPALGLSYSLPISGVLLCLMIFIVALIFILKLGKGLKSTYIKMGILWLLLTILLETVMGIAMGNTFSEILKAYDITTGNFWLIVVLFTGVVPYLVAKIKRII